MAGSGQGLATAGLSAKHVAFAFHRQNHGQARRPLRCK